MPITFAVPSSVLACLSHPKYAPDLQNALNKGIAQGVLLAGRNPAAATANLCDIWGYPSTSGGSTQPVRALPTAGYTIAVVSDSVADVMTTGTGAWQVAISYLDTAYLPHVAVYALNGQTAVTVAASIDGGAGGTVTNAMRQNGAEVVAVGTGGSNAGAIYVTGSTGQTYTAGVPQTPALVYDCILAGDNADSSSQFTVPAGYYGLITQLIPAVNDAGTTAKYGRSVVNITTGNNGIFLRFDLGGLSNNNNPVPINLSLFPVIQPQSDIRIQGQVGAATELGCANMIVIWPANA